MTIPAEPKPDARLSRARDAAVALFAAGAAVLLYFEFRAYVFEDAYITYRYADNLARGLGFVFNPGERVLGTSTPLYTLLLAALRTLGADLPAAGAALYAAGLAAVALGGAWVLRRYGHGNLGAVYAVAVLWGTGNSFRYFGMETTLYAALLLATVIAALRERPVAAGILLGLAFLTRYDAFMLTAALFVTLWLARRKLPWRTYLAAAAVVLPWLVFAFAYFGSVLPNTLAAKTGRVTILEYMAGSLERIVNGLVVPLNLVLPTSTALAWAAAAGLAAPLLFRTARLARRNVHLVLFLAFPALLWLGYALIGPPLPHDWYFLPGTFFVLLAGLLAWGETLESRVRGRWPAQCLPAVLALTLLAASALAFPAAVDAERQRMTRSVVYLRRAEAYELLGRWILRHGLQDLRLVTFEPGYLTYVTRNPVIDAVGLVSRDVPLAGSRRERLQQIVDDRHPDLVLASGLVLGRLRGPYVPLYHSATKSLYAESGVLEQRLDALARSWVSGGFGVHDGAGLRHPLRIDLDALTGDWIASGGGAVVGRPRELSFRGERTRGRYLQTAASNVVASPPIALDFDVLTFRVNAPRHAAVELLVDGQAVLAFDGRDDMGDEMEEVVWPVHSWRGRTAVLRLFDDSGQGYVALDGLASRRFARALPLDDFEADPRRFGERWAQGFGGRPCNFLVLARRYGLAAVLGKATAASLCRQGAQELVSRPLPIRRDRLAMTVLDFGGPKTRVELRAGGEVIHRFVGGRVRRPVGVVWDVSGLRGQEAVLAVVDDDPRLRYGIGIDDVVLFDWED